ncbi:hypothetical protein [Paenibacillus sp. Marseille-Q4541]|uniref:hypothetical protein n=1 Tax=Paenibacillus sp. Marseille-Q4541 TaxID=2831522 RepID=UPI001BA84D4C|nr:hypothetical protein [Paenibacillus sp. Marseille-Q4541]
MKDTEYAVLEWVDSDSDDASVICKNLSLDMATTLVNIAPSHLYREILEMSELRN